MKDSLQTGQVSAWDGDVRDEAEDNEDRKGKEEPPPEVRLMPGIDHRLDQSGTLLLSLGSR